MSTPLKDNGTRHTFETGALREVPVGKGRWDLIPFEPMMRLARHYENGAKKYAPRNWQKGLPLSNFLGALARHTFRLMEGDASEDHAAAIAWNIFGFMWTEQRIKDGLLPQSLNDLDPIPEWQPPPAQQQDVEITIAPFALNIAAPKGSTLADYISKVQVAESEGGNPD